MFVCRVRRPTMSDQLITVTDFFFDRHRLRHSESLVECHIEFSEESQIGFSRDEGNVVEEKAKLEEKNLGHHIHSTD